jgi:DNA-binding transcriptional MerR regulator
MSHYFTSGQVARKLHVSISTLKRWLAYPELDIGENRNYAGWRLFSEDDLETLKQFKKNAKRSGKRFNKSTLIPIQEKKEI